jgi:hypothetical protein
VTEWSLLGHAYGPADDIPGLLGQAGTDEHSAAWDDLWSRLCHQGSVYSASFAALPLLSEMAAGQVNALLLAAAIVSSVDQQFDEIDPHRTYPAEMARLKETTEAALQNQTDEDTYVYLLQALLAFEGVEVWSDQLDRINDGEFEVVCSHCEEESSVELGQGTPAESAQLSGIGKRLHDRAIADGHPQVAEKLTHLFGEADCAACGERFRVDEAVALRY